MADPPPPYSATETPPSYTTVISHTGPDFPSCIAACFLGPVGAILALIFFQRRNDRWWALCTGASFFVLVLVNAIVAVFSNPALIPLVACILLPVFLSSLIYWIKAMT